MKKLKISQKLMLGVAGQLIFIVLLGYFIFSLNGKLKYVSETTMDVATHVDEVKLLASLSKDFVNDKVDYASIDKTFSDVIETTDDEKIKSALLSMKINLEDIDKLKKGNLEIENQVMSLTGNSINQSNSFINAMSEKLADSKQRNAVSTLERLVIGGANQNTNSNYQLKVLFLKMKENIHVKEELFSALDMMIKQAEMDMDRLKNTPFAQLPVEANKANHKTHQLTEQFVSNIEEMNQLSQDVYQSTTEMYKTLTDQSEGAMDAGFGNIKASFINVFLVLMLISIVLIVINFSLSRLIGLVFGQLNSDMDKIANGDLNLKLMKKFKDRQDEAGNVARSIIKLVDNLRNIIGNIRSGAESVASAGRQISSGSQQMSQGASEQAASVEEVSSTMEQISANIQQNTDNAQTTEKISKKAQEGMSEVTQRASKSLKATKEIAEKIQIINDIAFQTNILALNAAVEAARAGEHGKGFAVVAAEVRKLAERSKHAADEIVGLAQESYSLAEGAGKRMIETLPEVENTTSLVQEISAASIEQTNGVNQVNSAIQQLNSVTQQNAAASEELATSSEELSGQAESLKDLVAYFILDAEKETQGKSLIRESHAHYTALKKDKPEEFKKISGNSKLQEFESTDSDDNFMNF